MTVEGARSHRPASLRGRGDELERTLSVIERARDTGQATLIAIVGEAGIGKTAFLNTIVDGGQRAGFATGIGRAHERDQIAPMTPLLEALRSGPSPLLSRAGFADLAPLYGHQPWLVDALTGMLEELVLKSPTDRDRRHPVGRSTQHVRTQNHSSQTCRVSDCVGLNQPASIHGHERAYRCGVERRTGGSRRARSSGSERSRRAGL